MQMENASEPGHFLTLVRLSASSRHGRGKLEKNRQREQPRTHPLILTLIWNEHYFDQSHIYKVKPPAIP